MDMRYTRNRIAQDMRSYAEAQARYYGGQAITDMQKTLDAPPELAPTYTAFSMISAARAAGWARIALEANTIALNF